MNKVKSMWQIIQSDDYTATTPNLMTFRILFALFGVGINRLQMDSLTRDSKA